MWDASDAHLDLSDRDSDSPALVVEANLAIEDKERELAAEGESVQKARLKVLQGVEEKVNDYNTELGVKMKQQADAKQK